MDLTTQYLGLELRTPLIAGAGPVTGELGNIRSLEDHGAGAVVLPSVFEEEIEREQRLLDELVTGTAESHGEALSYFPGPATAALAPDRYLDLVRRARAAVEIPVIASLNGFTDHGWVGFAADLEAAGASAIELNIYFIPSDLAMSGAAVERRYLDILKSVKAAVNVPVAVKIGPYFSAPGHMCCALAQAGADGLVLFNRFYEPDIDLEKLALRSDLELSTRYEIRLPLLWIGVLHGRVPASLAASTGVADVSEVLKYLLVGADVVMSTSALLRHGPGHIAVLRNALEQWLDSRGLDSLQPIRGVMCHRQTSDPAAFERANYIRTLHGARGGA